MENEIKIKSKTIVQEIHRIANERIHNTFKIHNSLVTIIIQKKFTCTIIIILNSRNIQNFKIQKIFQKRKLILRRVVQRGERGYVLGQGWHAWGSDCERSRRSQIVRDHQLLRRVTSTPGFRRGIRVTRVTRC